MKHNTRILALFSLLVFACKKDGNEEARSLPVYDPSLYEMETGFLPPPALPEDNIPTVQGVKLGRMLFYEKALSQGNIQSCADCHKQIDGFSDINQFSTGVDGLQGNRQAMAIFNLAWHTDGFFWDGRSPTLRDQALRPIQDPLEMNESLEDVVEKLQAMKEYRDQFVRAFGTEEINPERIGLALEQFMLSVTSVRSRYDRFLLGEAEFTESELRGRDLFFAEFDPFGTEQGAECFHCHGGPNFTNNAYMNNGLDGEGQFSDPGRFAHTGDPGDMGRFKVPSLRNIAVTPPYMHDGRFATLQEVMGHYNNGVLESSTLDPLMQFNVNPGLGLTQQDIDDLIAFMHTLTDEYFLENEEYANPF